MVLKASGYRAGMGPLIPFEGIGDPVIVENFMQTAGAIPQAALIAHVDRNDLIPPQISDALVDLNATLEPDAS